MRHVVAQIIESEFVISAVGHIRSVGLTPGIGIEPPNNDTRAEAKKSVQLPHPRRVTLGQIIVNGHHVNAFA